jgi:hypothetical protein
MLPPCHLSKVADDIRFSNVAHCDEFQNGGNRGRVDDSNWCDGAVSASQLRTGQGVISESKSRSSRRGCQQRADA